MKKKTLYTLLAAAVLAAGSTLTSCSVENPLDEEQYVKKVSIVGAYNIIQTKKVNYSGDGSFYTSVSIGGSLPPETDVNVTLGLADPENLVAYNRKNVLPGEIKYQDLPTDWYKLDNWTTTIKAGELYARVPITVDVSKIEADSLYVIPLEIKSVSAYEKVDADTVLLLNIKMINNYSGTYNYTGTVTKIVNGEPDLGSVSKVNATRTLTAIDAGTVRLYKNSDVQKMENLDASAYTMTINSDNSVTIKPWKDLNITESSGTFDPEKNEFKIKYTTVENGTTYLTEATIETGETGITDKDQK